MTVDLFATPLVLAFETTNAFPIRKGGEQNEGCSTGKIDLLLSEGRSVVSRLVAKATKNKRCCEINAHRCKPRLGRHKESHKVYMYYLES